MMSGYKGIDAETMEAAADTIVTRGWWSDEEKAKFLEIWHKAKSKQLSPVLMADDSSGSVTIPPPVEKTINDVLDILAKDKVGRGAAEQIKGAAEQSIRRQTRDGGLNDAIKGR